MLDKDSYAYKKYVSCHDPHSPENVAKRKREKADERRVWWAANWISLLGILIAIIALVISFLSLRISWLSYTAESRVQEVAQCEAEGEPAQSDADKSQCQ